MAMELIIGVLVTAIISLYLYLTRNYNYWKERNVPHVQPKFIFGNVFDIFALKTSIGDYMYQLHKSTNDPYTGFFAFDRPYLLIRDTNLIKSILVRDFDHFNDRSIVENHNADRLGSNILFLVRNPTWQQMRKKISPAYTTGKMKNMIPGLIQVSNNMINYLKKLTKLEKSVDAREVAMKFATDVVAACGYGTEANSFKFEDAAFRKASKRLFFLNSRRTFDINSYYIAPLLVGLFKLKFIDSAFGRFIEKTLGEIFKIRMESGSKRGDIIDVVLQLMKENKYDGKLLLSQAANILIAGVDTTGSTISFALYELSLHKAVQEKLRNEIKTVIKRYNDISYEVVQDMPYLNMVIYETLRKYPVLPYLDRLCTKPYKLPESNLTIEKGTPIYISLTGLHYDSDYFPEPHKFDPERFSSENKSCMKGFSYMPFGEGPHNCIGQRFGLLGTKMGLVQILNNFIVESNERTEVPLTYTKDFLLSPKDGVNISFKLDEEAIII